MVSGPFFPLGESVSLHPCKDGALFPAVEAVQLPGKYCEMEAVRSVSVCTY